MTKTIVLEDEIHRDLKKVQALLYEKYDVEMHMQDILLFATRKSGISHHEKIAKEIVEEIKGNKNENIWEVVKKRADIASIPLVKVS